MGQMRLGIEEFRNCEFINDNFRHFSPGPDLAKPDPSKINQD